MLNRASGVLLPVFSLPSKYGIGTFGKDAYKFVRYLEKMGMTYWQMLPLNPTSFGDSPYQSFSAFALNPYFIDLEMLRKDGYLQKEDLKPLNHRYQRSIDYGELYNKRFAVLRKAYMLAKDDYKAEIDKFAKRNAYWVKDYALFMVIKDLNKGQSWLNWEDDYRLRKKKALAKVSEEHKEDIGFWIFLQFIAHQQYVKLRKYAHRHHVKIIGDIPIYVAMDSADVWANPGLFQLDRDRRPVKVSGVPPDYFSKTGQLWGNPLYDYEAMEKHHFLWWKRRVKNCAGLFDVLRIDHFRGMEAYWAVPYGETTAVNGEWIKGPGMKLVNAIKEAGGKKLDIIAEDLGLLTPEVIKLKEESGWPGLAVYEFAFDPNDPNYTSSYYPENYKENVVAYLGTHDNDTVMHYLKTAEPTRLKPFIYHYLGDVKDDESAAKEMIRRMLVSKADTVIFLIQDLFLENEARINTPGTSGNNWQYRLSKDYFNTTLAERIRELVVASKRYGNK